MKNRLVLMLRRSCRVLIVLIPFLAFANSAWAQQTLCQQFGENFVPDITIGTNESSITFSANLGVAGWTQKNVVINGTFVVNSNFQIYNCSLKMGKNAIIRIDPNVTFGSYFSKYFRCGTDLWTGFVATGGNNSFFFNQIEDAFVAMDIKSASASVVLVANYINRNIVGLKASNIAVNAILAANRFESTSNLNGSNTTSFAGVQLDNCPSAAIGLTVHEPAYRNVYKNQEFGIKLYNSTTTIGLSTFYDNHNGVFADYSVVWMQGAGANLTTNFAQNRQDVNATHTGLNMFFCYLDSCETTNISSVNNINLEQICIRDNRVVAQ